MPSTTSGFATCSSSALSLILPLWRKTRTLMNSSVRDSLVEGFEHLIPAIELPDADDRHVVAALFSGAETIVTFNLSRIFRPLRWTATT